MTTIVRRLSISFIALLTALAVAELVVRFVDPSPSYRSRAQAAYACDQHHPQRGWAGIPNLDEPFVRPDFATQVRTNSDGFRTDAFDVPVDAEATHVVVLGDSFGWGWGVEEDERFDRVLENEATDVICTNLSQPGYGTDQELLTLREYGPRLNPDIVLLLFSHNDLKNVAARQQYGKPKPLFRPGDDGTLELTGVPVPADAAGWKERRRLALQLESELSTAAQWLERSHLYNWIANRRTASGSEAATERRAEADAEVLERGAANATALLLLIAAECERMEARFVVAWNPRRPEVDGRLPGGEWQTELERGLGAIETIDLLDGLQACGGRLYFREDPHWTARAHACVGRALAQGL